MHPNPFSERTKLLTATTRLGPVFVRARGSTRYRRRFDPHEQPPGHRDHWEIRPTWHGLVYAGKAGTGTESIVNPDALPAWPIRFDGNGKLAKPPADSKHHDAVVTTAAKPKPYRRRRSSAQLTAEVIDLHKRGLVPVAIGNQLNVSDRRIKAILAQSVAA